MPSLFGFIPSVSIPESYADFSNGINGTADGWSTYASGTIGLSGPLHHDGWRLKMTGSYSRNAYSARDAAICRKNHDASNTQKSPTIAKICDSLMDDDPTDSSQTQDFLAAYGMKIEGKNLVQYSEHQADRFRVGIMPGYQATLAGLTLKAYLGLAYEHEIVLPDDPYRSIPADSWGAQGALEAWIWLTENGWLSADASYYSGTSSYSAAMKLGYQQFSWLSYGPEFAGFGDDDSSSGRAGAFLRFDTGKVETTLSGGISGAYKELDESSLYGAANLYLRF